VKLVPAVIIAADVAVVTYVEKVLMAGRKAAAGHPAVPPAAPKELIIVGLVFALPALILILAALLRSRGTAQAAPQPRYTFGGPR
jgi:hypothetical protein